MFGPPCGEKDIQRCDDRRRRLLTAAERRRPIRAEAEGGRAGSGRRVSPLPPSARTEKKYRRRCVAMSSASRAADPPAALGCPGATGPPGLRS